MKTKDPEYMKKYVAVLKTYFDWVSSPSNSTSWCQREAYHHIISGMNKGGSLNMNPCEWPFSVVMGVGRELFQIIMAKIQFRMDAKGQIVINNMKVKLKSDGNIEVFQDTGPSLAKNKTFPVLFRIFSRMRKQSHFVEEVKPHPVLAKLFCKQIFDTLMFPVDQLPMLVPPLPWTSPQHGGYLLHPSILIRVSELQVSPQYTQMLDERTQNIHLHMTSWCF